METVILGPTISSPEKEKLSEPPIPTDKKKQYFHG
jgi:hypothetical protein